MSTHNIVSKTPRGSEEVVVTFYCKDGSLRSYLYKGADAIAVMMGSDPADLNGERIQSVGISMPDLADAVELL